MDVLAGVAALVGPVAKVEALLAPHAVRRGRAAKVSTVIYVLSDRHRNNDMRL